MLALQGHVGRHLCALTQMPTRLGVFLYLGTLHLQGMFILASPWLFSSFSLIAGGRALSFWVPIVPASFARSARSLPVQTPFPLVT